MTARWRAPGRVNLIGEHTDYNDGFVLPFALEQGCTASVSPIGSGVRVSSAQRHDVVSVSGDLEPGSYGWADYVLGVLWALQQDGHTLPGLVIEVTSDVPAGAGLSSSAALVCSVATAVDDALSLGLTAEELLRVTRRAENDFVGARTGGMDQLASLRCTEEHALLADMRTLTTEQVPLALGSHVVLVLDTHAPHQHADGAYRLRRESCERAAAALGVRALRDATDLGQLDRLPEELRPFARHVVTENQRVLDMVAALRAGDLPHVGELMTASHASMRDDFRITVPEVDLAAETLMEAGALGARMTGGGFGGCVIAVVDRARATGAGDAVADAFARHGHAAPSYFMARASAGAHRLP